MKYFLYALTFAAMTLTVPWFFSAGSHTEGLFSLPAWVVYVIAASFLYAVLIAACVRYFWDVSAVEPEDHSSEENDDAGFDP